MNNLAFPFLSGSSTSLCTFRWRWLQKPYTAEIGNRVSGHHNSPQFYTYLLYVHMRNKDAVALGVYVWNMFCSTLDSDRAHTSLEDSITRQRLDSNDMMSLIHCCLRSILGAFHWLSILVDEFWFLYLFRVWTCEHVQTWMNVRVSMYALLAHMCGV